MLKNEVQATETVVEEAVAAAGLSRNAKIGIAVGAALLTGGLSYGVYRLVKFVRSRKAAKAASPEQPEPEVVEEAHE